MTAFLEDFSENRASRPGLSPTRLNAVASAFLIWAMPTFWESGSFVLGWRKTGSDSVAPSFFLFWIYFRRIVAAQFSLSLVLYGSACALGS